jgi:Cu/Ag efflux pump CusA
VLHCRRGKDGKRRDLWFPCEHTSRPGTDAKIKKINRTLPLGIGAETVLKRTQLVDVAIRAVAIELAKGALLVVLRTFEHLAEIMRERE